MLPIDVNACVVYIIFYYREEVLVEFFFLPRIVAEFIGGHCGEGRNTASVCDGSSLLWF